MIKTLREDLIKAMKEKNTIKKNILQVVINKINLAAKDKKVEVLPEDQQLAIIQTVLKQSNEALNDFVKSGREDLINQAETEIAILKSYLPKQLDESEITEVVEETIKELNIEKKITNKGILMKTLTAKLRGKADGKLINEVVTKILS